MSTMNILQKIWRPAKSDQFGINTSIGAIRQLREQVSTQNKKLIDVQNKARDSALAGQDFDETAIIKQERRIAVFEAALAKVVDEASKQLNSHMPEIDKEISYLESQKQKSPESATLSISLWSVISSKKQGQNCLECHQKTVVGRYRSLQPWRWIKTPCPLSWQDCHNLGAQKRLSYQLKCGQSVIGSTN